MGGNVGQFVHSHDATTEDDKVLDDYASVVTPSGQPPLKSEHLDESPKDKSV